MPLQLLKRRSILLPTLLGWLALGAAVALVAAVALWQGEAFFRLNERLPADVLVVEGWIGPEGVRAAGLEFQRGAYRYVVATGGLSDIRWSDSQWSFTQEAAKQLRLCGIPQESIIIAPPQNTASQRTFQSARAVQTRLQAVYPEAKAVNVFTLGAHARRSRLIFSEVLTVPVGVISWVPASFGDARWWRSSSRAEDVLKETAGYFYEVLLRSGRGFGQPS